MAIRTPESPVSNKSRNRFDDPTEREDTGGVPLAQRDAWAGHTTPLFAEEVLVSRRNRGELRYWTCPKCRRRCRFLYGTSTTWTCQQCADIREPDRSRVRSEPEQGHRVALFDRAIARRDAWAGNPSPTGAEEKMVSRHLGGSVRFWVCPACKRNCRYMYASAHGWLCQRCVRVRYASSLEPPGPQRSFIVADNRQYQFARRHPDAVRIPANGWPSPRGVENGRHLDRWAQLVAEFHRIQLEVLVPQLRPNGSRCPLSGTTGETTADDFQGRGSVSQELACRGERIGQKLIRKERKEPNDHGKGARAVHIGAIEQRSGSRAF